MCVIVALAAPLHCAAGLHISPRLAFVVRCLHLHLDPVFPWLSVGWAVPRWNVCEQLTRVCLQCRRLRVIMVNILMSPRLSAGSLIRWKTPPGLCSPARIFPNICSIKMPTVLMSCHCGVPVCFRAYLICTLLLYISVSLLFALDRLFWLLLLFYPSSNHFSYF